MTSWEDPIVITNIALAIVNAFMAAFTAYMACQTKRAVDEPRKREVEQAFQSLFLTLRKDILNWDNLYRNYQYGNLRISDLSDVEAIKGSVKLIV